MVFDGAVIATAVCHGPEAFICSKWMRDGRFTADTGRWKSFHDVLDRFEKRKRKKPGETVRDGNEFTVSLPNATKEMMQQVRAATFELGTSAGQLN